MRLDKKDAKQKARDLLGFSSFFAVFRHFACKVRLFSKFELKQKQKDAKRCFRPAVRIGPVALTSDRFFDIMFILENHNSQRGEYGITN